MSHLAVVVGEFSCYKQERIRPKQADIETSADLSKSLLDLTISYHRNGQQDRALEMAQQALGICERLAQQKPERFEPDWAGSLNNCGNRLADMGQHDHALEMAQRALGIYQRLAQQKPERFEPDWAMSLNNCAHHLATMGQHDRALEMAHQPLGIYQRLAIQKPERFEPDLFSPIKKKVAVTSVSFKMANAATV